MSNNEIAQELREAAETVKRGGWPKHFTIETLEAAADIVEDYDNICGFLADAIDGRVVKLKAERDALRAKVVEVETENAKLRGKLSAAQTEVTGLTQIAATYEAEIKTLKNS